MRKTPIFALLLSASFTFAQGHTFGPTSFPLTENPISQGGQWLNGSTNCSGNWTNMATDGTKVYGTALNPDPPFNDDSAWLNATWGPTQTVQATLVLGSTGTLSQAEVEIHLNTSCSGGQLSTYEFNESVLSGVPYMYIVRWNGPLNSYTILAGPYSSHVAVNGDVLKATRVGSLLTFYLNGSSILSVNDSTFTAGSPGVGQWCVGTTVSDCKGFGLTAFSANDGSSGPGTYTASSDAESDVNAIINGPTHTAVNGDIIQIPCSGTQSVTWTSTLSTTKTITITALGGMPNTTASTFGSGTNCLTIKDNVASGALFSFTPTYASSNNVVTLQNMNIDPLTTSTALTSPVQVGGTCTSSGCPNLRVDNIGFGIGTQWNEGTNGASSDWMIRTDNVFGVLDHNTVPSGSDVELLNANHSAYLGVGGYGDNSWAQPDTFGGANVLYMENNSVYTSQAVNDCDTGPTGGGIGGCRIAGRFNHVTGATGMFSAFYVHGLDTDGRPQGGRQMEAYGNTLNCATSGGCDLGMASFRSGTGYVFGNTLTSSGGGFYNNVAGIYVYRTVFNASTWGACGGSSAWDTNDGTVYYTGTVTTAATPTMTDSTKTWTTNQFVPTGAPYTVYDVTQGWWAEILSNTSNTITIQGSIPEEPLNFVNGDSYEILRATVCADQGGRGAGNYVSGSTPSPASALSQALDPIYEWDDTASPIYHGNISSDTLRTIANRDWYTDGSNGSPVAQTSPTSPFNGTSGVGFGTLANRPTTCTTHVGYFATDQGSWNTSGNGFGQGQLYSCSATNTWTVLYTPYTYPHPLVSGVTTYTWNPTIVGSGSLTGTNCGPGSYASGTTIGGCTASAGTGSTFSAWSSVSGSAACSGATNPCASFSITANSAATATFTVNSYALSTATSGAGSGTITGCAGSVNYGAGYSCTVTATGGSTLASVSGCGGSGTTTYTGTMPASNCTVTATFNLTSSLKPGNITLVISGTQ